MTDKEKLEKIRSEVIWYIHLRNEGLIIGSCGDFEKLLKFIDSMQEEPVSEDLEEAAKNHAVERFRTTRNEFLAEKCKWSFKAGAKWQKTKDESSTQDLGEYINELSKQFPEVSFAKLSRIAVRVAKWQKEKLWKPADGDDLPIIDREVVVLIKYDAQRNIHDEEYPTYRVGFGHRPNPDGWDGKDIDTNVITHYTPKLYDKGGWNAPNIVYWLDYDINELLCIEK